jgi:hypothetical protein
MGGWTDRMDTEDGGTMEGDRQDRKGAGEVRVRKEERGEKNLA